MASFISKHRGKKDSGISAILAVVIVVIVAALGISIYTGVLDIGLNTSGTPSTQTVTTTATDTPPSTGLFVGALAAKQVSFDSFDSGTSYTHGTNYNVYWFVNRGGNWMQLGSGDVTLELTDEDNGYIYALPAVIAGQDYYIDHAVTQAKNGRVRGVTYQDITNDQQEDFVFKIWIGDVPIPTSATNPQYTFYPYMRAYQLPTANNPANLSSIGTSAVSKFLNWEINFTNTKKSFMVTKVVFEYNSTDITKLDLDNVNIPGLGFISGTQFTYAKLASSTEYTYTIGSDLSNGLWVNYGTNQNNQFDFTTKITCHFSTSEVYLATITIYGLTVTESLTSVSNEIKLSA